MPRALIPGFAFKEGRLWIFTEAQVIQIEGWPDIAARRHTPPKGAWESFAPPFRLLRPPSARPLEGGEVAVGPCGVPGRTVHAEVERAVAFRGFRYTRHPRWRKPARCFPRVSGGCCGYALSARRRWNCWRRTPRWDSVSRIVRPCSSRGG